MEKDTFSMIQSSGLKVEDSNVLNVELSCSLRRGSKKFESNLIVHSTNSNSSSSKDSNISIKQPMRSCKFPSCDYRSDKQSNFNRHLITMHRQLKSQVICCDLSFKTKGELRHHTRTIHQTGHRCRLCGKIFNRKALLERHVSIHTGKKPYRCSLCDYASANKANVIRHLSIHKPEDAKITFCTETLNNSRNKRETPSSSSSMSSSSSVSSNETKFTSVSLTCSSATSPADSSLSNPFTLIKSEEEEERNKVKSKVWISHSIDSILGKSGKLKTSQLPSTKGQKAPTHQAHQNLDEQESISSLLPEPASLSRKSEKGNHQQNLDNWPQTNAEMSPGLKANWTHTSPLPWSLPPYPYNHLRYHHHHSNLSPLPATYLLEQCQSQPPPPASLDMMTMMMNQYQYQFSAQHQRYAPSPLSNRTTGSMEKVVNEGPPARPAQEVGNSSGNNSNNNGRIILNETTMMRGFELKTEEIEQEVVVDGNDDTAYVPKKLRTCKKYSVAEG